MGLVVGIILITISVTLFKISHDMKKDEEQRKKVALK
jgi:hypothetical protein